MLGNFSYCNPTKLYFGDNSLENLNTELKKYGKTWFWYTAAVRLRKTAFMTTL